MDKLSIQNEMANFDLKQRDFYDSLTDEEKKKFSNYLMIRWGSAVHGTKDLQEFYVISTNERLNKHFFAVNRHPRLQWLMATSVSPAMGRQRHQWVSPKKKDTGDTDTKKALMALYPNMKLDDISVLASMINKKDLKTHLDQHGE